MRDVANAVIIGNLTRDPEVSLITRKRDGEKVTVAKFSVACNFDDEASFFEVEAWGHTADAVDRFLMKGKRVAVVGRLKQDRWENKSGEKKSMVRIVASEVQFLTPKQDGQENGQAASAQPAEPADARHASDHRSGMDDVTATDTPAQGW